MNEDTIIVLYVLAMVGVVITFNEWDRVKDRPDRIIVLNIPLIIGALYAIHYFIGWYSFTGSI